MVGNTKEDVLPTLLEEQNLSAFISVMSLCYAEHVQARHYVLGVSSYLSTIKLPRIGHRHGDCVVTARMKGFLCKKQSGKRKHH